MASTRLRHGEAGYPGWLRSQEPPPDLYLRGRPLPRSLLAIVGTRRPTDGGRGFARRLAIGAVERGWGVVSGGALGIDAAAHEGALDVGGHSVWVAGAGLDQAYPAANAALMSRHARLGSLLSPYADGVPCRRPQFLRRNRIVAGLAAACVLVEFPFRSGSRNAAKAARTLEVPVWVTSQAPWSPFAPAHRKEISLGAEPLRCMAEFFDRLGPPSLPIGAPPTTQAPLARQPSLPLHQSGAKRGAAVAERELAALGLPGPQARLIAAVQGRRMHPEQLARELGVDLRALTGQLLQLRLRRLIKADEAGRVVAISSEEIS